MFKNFDVIIIGGGASGSGIALDASLRGLKTLIVEKGDFAQGTSSKSTKLIHGGVRYLENAIKKLDINEYKLVREGLQERKIFLENAPHLAHILTLVTPLYKWYEVPYMYIGLVLYDLIAGDKRLGRSSIVSRKNLIDSFPSVKKKGLKGGVRYFDGAFNDSRMVISLLQSAKELGGVVRNYTEVVDFLHKDDKINGVKLKNNITNEEYEVYAKIIINATGAFSDNIQKLDSKQAKNMIESSSGVHIVLDKKFLPNNEGLMIPKTKDGRVLFILPYLNKCLVGTTDRSEKAQENPIVSQDDIEYLLAHIREYFDLHIEKSDILSSWVGFRPLIINDDVNNTKNIVREYVITASSSGLINIIGGKWTIYRKMAEETLNFALNERHISNVDSCKTKNFKLVGSRKIINSDMLEKYNLDNQTKKHLMDFYGDCVSLVVKYIEKYGNQKLHKNYSYLEAEILYCIDYEFAVKPLDFLARRSGLYFIDKQAVLESLLPTTLIFKEKLKWSDDVFDKNLEEAKREI